MLLFCLLYVCRLLGYLFYIIKCKDVLNVNYISKFYFLYRIVLNVYKILNFFDLYIFRRKKKCFRCWFVKFYLYI